LTIWLFVLHPGTIRMHPCSSTETFRTLSTPDLHGYWGIATWWLLKTYSDVYGSFRKSFNRGNLGKTFNMFNFAGNGVTNPNSPMNSEDSSKNRSSASLCAPEATEWGPIRIWVGIDSPHPLVCRKKRLNIIQMRPEKPEHSDTEIFQFTSKKLKYFISYLFDFRKILQMEMNFIYISSKSFTILGTVFLVFSWSIILCKSVYTHWKGLETISIEICLCRF
jgi:hypothetical protein